MTAWLGWPSGLLRAQWPTADDFNPEANGRVLALAVQWDGRVLVGGEFTTLGGASRFGLGRLNPDGSLDLSFNPGGGTNVYCIAIQPDEKILVGGSFTNLAGQRRLGIGRLHPDGTLDTGFDPSADNRVVCFALQPDGKIVVGGDFTVLAGESRLRIARLNPDGTLDPTFNPGADRRVRCVALQPDGKIVVGGDFTTLAGQSCTNLGRLNPDGTLELSVDLGPIVRPTYYEPYASCVAVQSDGKILVGGRFASVARQARSNIARLNPDGSVDPDFDPGANWDVFCIGLQADGKILLGGWFGALGGLARPYIGRLRSDGSPDPDFDPRAQWLVYCVGLQPDGKVLVGGLFSAMGGQSRSRIARLNNTEPATESLTNAGSALLWLRGGTGPEVWRTTFETSSNGADWVSLGAGRRVAGGWELTELTLPLSALIRARGYVAGAYRNGSAWFVESWWGPPLVVTQPQSCTNLFGAMATFAASPVGSQPLSYQWFKDGVPLTDGDQVRGALSPTLTLSNVAGPDRGAYWLLVSNQWGSATSVAAILAVEDPWITTQPLDAERNTGETVTLSVAAVGSPPLTYQWYHEGVALPGATEWSLTLTNLQARDSGRYWVVVSNPYGAATSAPAMLRINVATVDLTFSPAVDFPVLAFVVQPDGRILIGGSFSRLNDQPRRGIARLHADGTVDPTFSLEADSGVSALAMQPDGKVVMGGSFTTVDGQPRARIARLNADGSLDQSFAPQVTGNPGLFGVAVYAIALQPDGKIVVGGNFTNVAGQTRLNIARINPDGTVDAAFSPAATGAVSCIALQSDGRIVVGGRFSGLAGQPRRGLGRLNPDGTLDTLFDPGATATGYPAFVYCLAVQPEGKIVVGGAFSKLAGQDRACIGRLNPDGTLDPSFAAAANTNVYTLALQTDGKILLGGAFTNLNGDRRLYLARLNPDGTVDPSFNLGLNAMVSSVAVQPDGHILVGGSFTSIGGLSRSRFARLHDGRPATESLTVQGSTITWLRGGTGPEVWRTTFEACINSGDWMPLGEGRRIPGGWQLTDAAVPANATIRARGWTRCGSSTGSEWFVESVARPALPIRLAINRSDAHVVLSWTGGQGPYQVQQCTDLSDPAGWTDLGEPVQTNSIALPIGPGNLFLRVRGQ